jgi:hypothetical protein
MQRRLVLVAGVLMAAVGGMQVLAQGSYSFLVVAGSNVFGTRDGIAAEAQFRFGPYDRIVGMVRDSAGNVIVADNRNSTLRKISPSGIVTTFAGSAVVGSADGTGASAQFNQPQGLAIDSADNVFVADRANNSIRRVTPAGVVTTLGTHPDMAPQGVAVASDGIVYAAGGVSHAIFRITTGGEVSVFAGTLSQSGSTDGTGSAARFRYPTAVAIEPATGDLLIADGQTNGVIRRMTPAGVVTTMTLSAGATVDNAAAFVFDPQGRMFIADGINLSLPFVGTAPPTPTRLQVLINGTVYPVSGGYPPGLTRIRGLVRETAGTFLIAEVEGHTIYRATVTDAGTLSAPGPFTLTYVPFASRPLACDAAAPADGSRLIQRFCDTRSVAVGRDGTMYIADVSYSTDVNSGIVSTRGHAIRTVTSAGVSSLLAGTLAASGAIDGAGTSARFGAVEARTDGVLGLAVDPAGVVFVADQGNSSIRRVAADGTTSTFAGLSGSAGSTDGTGTGARFNRPHDVAIDSGGNLFVADTGNSSIRKVTPAGVVTTFAGTSGAGGSTDGAGTAARFSSPYAIAVGADNSVYVADTGNHLIRKITPAGVVTTLAGTAGVAGSADGQGTAASFNAPRSIAVDASGIVYVGDRPGSTFAWRIRRISAAGQVTTISSTTYGDVTDVDAAGTIYLPYGATVVAGTTAGSTSAAPVVMTQPASQTVSAGQPVTFTVGASGAPTPTYRWQTSADGGTTWTDLSDAAPYSGASTATLSVSTTTLVYPLRRFRAVATNAFGTSTSNAAVLTVPGLLVSPSTLRFRVIKNGALGNVQEHQAQELLATFVGVAPGALTWSANQPWLGVTANPQGPAARVSIVNPDNVLLGTTSASGVITVSAPGGLSTQVPVTLEVLLDYRTSVAPIGQVDTPTQGATGVRGAIAFSGWATDDLGVGGVQVYRNCVPAEPQVNCQVGVIPGRSADRVVYMGAAQLVRGARPDIDTAFPDLVSGGRAGWGFLVLTNMLPRTTGTYSPYGGQGDITLYAVATDWDGHSVLLGRNWANDATPTTVTLDNDAIAKPFGTIDTPAQGETVQSASYNNYGWVLTPDSDIVQGNVDTDMANASGLTLFVDGLPITAIAYNQCRGNVGNPVPAGVYCNDDISNIFGNPTVQSALINRTSNPTKFRNLDAGRGAIGAAVLDITTLSNGLHTIAWSATDSANRVEGIGSRYFTVFRPQTAPATDTRSGGIGGIGGSDGNDGSGGNVGGALVGGRVFRPGETGETVVLGRAGFDLQAPWSSIGADADGVRRVHIDALGRMELWLGDGVDSGAQVSGETELPLPVGSHLNTKTGQFTWMPGPGFRGTYALTFVRGGERIPVNVTVRDAAETPAGASEIRMDAPVVRGCETLAALACNVGGAMTLTGRAWDPQSFAGSGIGAVHVWALRRDQPGAAAVFLGEATLNADGTYSLTHALARGMYDVTAYVWNIRTARFEDARTARVTTR